MNAKDDDNGAMGAVFKEVATQKWEEFVHTKWKYCVQFLGYDTLDEDDQLKARGKLRQA